MSNLYETPNEEIIQGIVKGFKEAINGDVLPLDVLFEDIEDEED